MKSNKIEIKTLKLSELIPYENNPRNNEPAVEAVKESIEAFGYRNPIIVDENNVILCGHTRLKALKKLGIEEVEVEIARDLTEDEKTAFRLADNKTAELAEWDFGMLAEELLDCELDMSLFGFDVISGDEYDDDFTLKDGDKEPTITMSITFSNDEADIVNEAIAEMKHTDKFHDYENPFNNNSNGKALFLVVEEWLTQRI